MKITSMLKKCCDKLDQVSQGSTKSEPFSKMKTVSILQSQWAVVMKCPTCSQRWLVEEWDKYHESLAIKIDSDFDLNDADSLLEKARDQSLILKYGGLSNDKCKWKGC